ncbi:MAG: lipoyl(octanoyl) transferase LipB [Bacteroidota bacterium]
MEKVSVEDLGKIRYKEAWDYQQQLLQDTVGIKLANRKLSPDDESYQIPPHHFLFCEHLPVYTLGKSGSASHLLLNQKELEEKGFEFFKINRGGDITYHGPGQVVGYPIFDLDRFFNDIHKYVRYIEEAIMRTLAEYGLETIRKEGYTGVWLAKTDVLPYRKICAIGVHMSRWVSMHGFALNVNTNLGHFHHIVPCGINEADMAVTSMELELGRKIDMEEVKQKIIRHFANLFQFEIVYNNQYEKGHSSV